MIREEGKQRKGRGKERHVEEREICLRLNEK